MRLPTKFTFIDVETTGTNPRRDRIIEVGALVVENNEIVETYSEVINPQTHIPPEITALTGISQSETERAHTFDSAAVNILSLLKDRVFVAHNARFDYAFLKHEFFRTGMQFSAKTLCTVKLSRKLFPSLPHHNLDTIIKTFGISCSARHRAYDDAKATYDFFCRATELTEISVFKNALTCLLKKPTLPDSLTEEQLNSLPEGPGVYIMYGKVLDNILKEPPILYIGKSVSVRDRVLSHFASDYQTTTEMNISQKVSHIETIETAGELGALIRESRYIKEKSPIYNKKLRRHQNITVLRKKENANGFLTVSIESFSAGSDIKDIVGIFRSKKKAIEAIRYLTEEYHLCPKLLGIESGKGACFHFQLEKCRGGCLGKENYLRYNIRFLQAFSSLKIPDWPFQEPIGIIEEYFAKKETHIIDKWLYLGSVCDNGSASEIKLYNPQFDWDIYKILKRYILNQKHTSNIIPIPRSEFQNIVSMAKD